MRLLAIFIDRAKEISDESNSNSESVQFDDNNDVVAWFQTAKGKCLPGQSLPTPTSYLELESFADILKQVLLLSEVLELIFCRKMYSAMNAWYHWVWIGRCWKAGRWLQPHRLGNTYTSDFGKKLPMPRKHTWTLPTSITLQFWNRAVKADFTVKVLKLKRKFFIFTRIYQPRFEEHRILVLPLKLISYAFAKYSKWHFIHRSKL